MAQATNQAQIVEGAEIDPSQAVTHIAFFDADGNPVDVGGGGGGPIAIGDVTGLQAALDGKQDSGDYATASDLDAKADQSFVTSEIARLEALINGEG